MRLATYQGESDLKTLVKRLFRSRGPEPEAFEKEAEAALLRANPQLRDLKELPKGVAIMVPEVRGIKPTAEVRMPGDWADKLLAEVRQAVAGLGPALKESAARQEEAANQTLELLKSKEMKELAKSSPAWQERFRKIADAARARIKKAQAEKESQEKLVAQMEKDLDEVSKLFT
jgi:hypothetical protein